MRVNSERETIIQRRQQQQQEQCMICGQRQSLTEREEGTHEFVAGPANDQSNRGSQLMNPGARKETTAEKKPCSTLSLLLFAFLGLPVLVSLSVLSTHRPPDTHGWSIFFFFCI